LLEITRLFLAVLRVAPNGVPNAQNVITLFNPAAGNAEVHNYRQGGNCTLTTPTALDIVSSSFTVSYTPPNPSLAGDRMGIHYTADAEIWA
jgi:hypothetical protein